MNTQTKPANFTSYPWSSVFGKSENEVVALNIMKVLARTGNEWRPLTWNEYQTERQKDGNFSLSEKLYFEHVLPYCESPEKANSFSPYWKVPIRTTGQKIMCYTLSMGDGQLIDSSIKNILETLRIELEENLTEDDPMSFDFGVVYLTQDEINEIPDFAGF